MTARLSYRFQPLADLFLLLVDPHRAPTGGAWDAARDVMSRCTATIAEAARGPRMADIAFFGHVAEHRSIDALEGGLADLPDESVLGLPWRALTELVIEALRLVEPLYRSELMADREAFVRHAIASRLEEVLVPKEAECLAFVADRLELGNNDREFPVVLTGSIPFPGAFTSMSDATGGACFVGVEGLDGTSLAETIVHEATHALDITANDRRTSVLARLGARVREELADPRFFEVPHSLIFVQAGETIRRVVDPRHVHYGVTHTYYDRVPTSKVVLEHWVRHLDGEIDADGAIEAIVTELKDSA